jgi:hypothetical protein
MVDTVLFQVSHPGSGIPSENLEPMVEQDVAPDGG